MVKKVRSAVWSSITSVLDGIGQELRTISFWGAVVLLMGFIISYVPAPPLTWFSPILLLFVACILILWYWGAGRIDIHANPEDSPPIDKEIEKAKDVWISWHTGASTGNRTVLARESNGVKLGSRISKAILLSQGQEPGQYLPIHAKYSSPKKEPSSLSTDIGEAIDQLRSSGVEQIKTFDGPLAHLPFLHFENPKRSKIRVEQWAPYLAQNDRPIYYIARRNSKVFEALERAFLEAWKTGESTQSDPDTADSQPGPTPA